MSYTSNEEGDNNDEKILLQIIENNKKDKEQKIESK